MSPSSNLYIFELTLFIAGVVNVLCYVAVSKKVNSWINCFSLYYGSSFVLKILLDYLGIAGLIGATSSFRAFLFCHTTYMVEDVTFMLVVCLARPPKLAWLQTARRPLRIRMAPWVLLIVSYIIYLPVLVVFRGFLLTPRMIYIQTRTGYGLNFFLSTAMCDCALIVYLFKQDRSKAGFFIFFLAAACLLFWHGSKGAVVLPLLIFMSYLVHVRDRRFTLTHAAAGGGIALAMFALSFLLLSNSKEQVSLLSSMMSFSDYSRNAEMVIDSPPPKYPYLGRLELEQIIYARIPRLLMPNKPTVYGQFHLNDYYSPVQFYQDTGAGSYGIGTVYADFGPFSMLLLALEQGAAAYIAIGVLRLLLIQPTPGLFILLCYLCGMSVIPITESYIFPETLILGLVIDRCASLPWTLVWRRNALTPGP